VRSIIRAAIALLSGVITSFVAGQLFVWLYLTPLLDLARRNASMVSDVSPNSPMGADQVAAVVTWQIERFHSRGWWITSLIGFLMGFFLVWKHAFRPAAIKGKLEKGRN
jgi:hypothetical protein